MAKILEKEKMQTPKKEVVKDKDSLLAEKIDRTFSSKQPTKVSVATQSPAVTFPLKTSLFLQSQQTPQTIPQTMKVLQSKGNFSQQKNCVSEVSKIAEVKKYSEQEHMSTMTKDVSSKENLQQTSFFSPQTTKNEKIKNSLQKSLPLITKVIENKDNSQQQLTFGFSPSTIISNSAEQNALQKKANSSFPLLVTTPVVTETTEQTMQRQETFTVPITSPKIAEIKENTEQPEVAATPKVVNTNNIVENKETVFQQQPINSLTPQLPTTVNSQIVSSTVSESTPVKFSFRPPNSSINTSQNQPIISSLVQGAGLFPNIQNNVDIGMDDEMVALASTPICQPSSGGVSFNFNQ